MTLPFPSCSMPPPHLYPMRAVSLPAHYSSPAAALAQQALDLLTSDMGKTDALLSPHAVRDHLRFLLVDRPLEVFAVVFLNAVAMFGGALTQTSFYPREVLIEALSRNAAVVIRAHSHPSAHPGAFQGR